MKSKQGFIKGALILGVSGVIARFLGLFFRWPVTMLIGDEGIGLYQLSYPLYMFIISIMSGFPIAISSMVSERAALGKKEQAYEVFKISLVILLIIGTVSSFGLYIFTPYIIKALKWRSDVYYSIVAIAFAPIFISIMDAYRGYFQGLQMMVMPAASQIVEQLGRVIVGVAAAYFLLPYGISYSSAGASFGACAGAIFGVILLTAGYIKNKQYIVPRLNGKGKDSNFHEKKRDIIKSLLSSAIPISIGMTVGTIMSLIDSLIVPAQLLNAGFNQKVATELYGQLTGKAHVLINVPLALSTALSTSIVPAMSEVKALRSIEKIGNRSQTSVKLAMVLGLPSSVGLFILADPILCLIFPGRSEGSDILRILSLSIIFIVLTQVFTAILQGVGEYMAPVKNLAIGALFKLVLSYILTGIPMLNIKGAAISSIIGYGIAALLNFNIIKRKIYFSFDIDKMLLRPLFATLAMGICVYFMYNKFMNITKSNGISTIVSVVSGIALYLILLIGMRIISKEEASGYILHRRKR